MCRKRFKVGVRACVPATECALPTPPRPPVGATHSSLLARTQDAVFEHMWATNVVPAIALSRFAVKAMMPHKAGAILHIGSVVGSAGNPGQTAYATSKSALVGMFE